MAAMQTSVDPRAPITLDAVVQLAEVLAWRQGAPLSIGQSSTLKSVYHRLCGRPGERLSELVAAVSARPEFAAPLESTRPAV